MQGKMQKIKGNILRIYAGCEITVCVFCARFAQKTAGERGAADPDRSRETRIIARKIVYIGETTGAVE